MMRVECINQLTEHGVKHMRLNLGKSYFVLGIEDDYFRILDNNLYPDLYLKSNFMIVDATIPDSWIFTVDRLGMVRVGFAVFETIPYFWDLLSNHETESEVQWTYFCDMMGNEIIPIG